MTREVNRQLDMGLRYDEGKLRLDLIPLEWYEALGAVMTVGADL